MNSPKKLLQTKMLSLCSLIMCDRRRSLHNIARQIGIRFRAVQCILTYFRKSKVSPRWVPRILTKDQEKSRLGISSKYLVSMKSNPEEFICRVVTQDETWGPSL